MYLCLLFSTPHTFAEQTSEFRVSDSLVQWLDSVTKKKSESKPALFVFIKNPQHVCLVFYTLFCALRVSDYKGIINMSFKIDGFLLKEFCFVFRFLIMKIPRLVFVSVLNRLCQMFNFRFPIYQFLKETDGNSKLFWIGVTMRDLGISGGYQMNLFVQSFYCVISSFRGWENEKEIFQAKRCPKNLLLQIMKTAKAGSRFELVSNKTLLSCCKW